MRISGGGSPVGHRGCRCCCLPWPIGCFGRSYAWREKLIIVMAVSGRRTCVLRETIRFGHHTWLQHPAAALYDPVKSVALITRIMHIGFLFSLMLEALCIYIIMEEELNFFIKSQMIYTKLTSLVLCLLYWIGSVTRWIEFDCGPSVSHGPDLG